MLILYQMIMSDELTYEQAYQQLEAIVNEVESGETSVDVLTQRLKQAKQLLEFCYNKLQKVEEEIKDIEQTGEKLPTCNKTAEGMNN